MGLYKDIYSFSRWIGHKLGLWWIKKSTETALGPILMEHWSIVSIYGIPDRIR